MTNCREIEPQLSLLVDGVLAAKYQLAVRAHVANCEACSGLLADLERLHRTASGLGPMTPPDHVWLGVAGQIRLEPAPLTPYRPAPPRTAIVQWIGLAAALVLITVGSYYFVRDTPSTSSSSSTASNVPPTGTVEAVAEELNLAMKHYERAITELETLAKSDTSALDPAVATTLRQNIRTIDQAIAESRGALNDDPGSEPARESLFEALRRKVVVLQATVTLMNEMRKGNQAGAAEAAAAVSKKG